MASAPAAVASSEALSELAAVLAAASFATLAPAARDCARQRCLDALGAMALGFATAEGQLLRRYATKLGAARSFDMLERCRVNVGAIRTTEIDDIDIASCTTVGAVVVPAAFAVAVSVRCDDRRLLAGVVAGYEAMIRLGRAIGGATLLYRGVWPTYVTAAFGAAATTAKLLDLSPADTARALGLALARTAPLPAAALTRSGFRYFALGGAAADGVAAAFAAAAGLDADLEGLAAFAERCGADLELSALTADQGAQWLMQAVDTKPWPGARQSLASVAAFEQLVPRQARPADIDRVAVDVPGVYRAMIDRPALPQQRIDSLLGVQYQLALAAFAPESLYDALRNALPVEPRIAAFLANVEVLADESLDARFPQRWGSRVTLRLRSGAELSAEVLEPPGSGRQALDWGALESKLARIFAASGVPRAPALAALTERCRMLAAGDGAGTDASELLAAAEALADSVGPGASGAS